MDIVVLMKQVPRTSMVEVDASTGTLRREGVASQTNPYDLNALEAALVLREKYGGRVTVISMGPPQAEQVIREAYYMGADRGILLTDRVFAGADTLATSFTLSQAIRCTGFDLIVAGMQSTDGDTAQVGPGVAEFLGIPHVSYVRQIRGVENGWISVVSDLGDAHVELQVRLPCLLTVTRDINQPRLPSFRAMKESRDKAVEVWSAGDLPESEISYYGLRGSPTRVERVFTPVSKRVHELWEEPPDGAAARLARLLQELTTR